MLKLNIILRMKETFVHSGYKRYLPEMMIYMAVWGIVILFPVVSHFFDYLSGKDTGMGWGEILSAWIDASPFLLLFVLNNRLLAPRLFMRQKLVVYVASATLCVLLTFGMMNLVMKDRVPQNFRMEMKKNRHHVYPGVGDIRSEANAHSESKAHPEADVLLETEARPEYKAGQVRPDKVYPDGRRMGKPLQGHPPFFVFLFRGPFLGQVMIALLMFSFNIAVKLFFKSVRDEEAMKELEHHNLHSELEYLKYQINPHFFMNTLNNIHALVDLDTEKAKETIVELSRLMRYMLYESDKRTLPLSKEVQFLRHYVELMRIRYPESVRIELSLPEEESGVQVPPLLFISFVENAFKHGVSYQKDSFITVSLTLERRELLFRCSNSNFGKNVDEHHGIGLENVRKRLQLLFGDEYTLAISNMEQRFDVLLTIPIGK